MNSLSDVIFLALRERTLNLPASAVGLRSHALPTEDHLDELLRAVERLFEDGTLSNAIVVVGSSAVPTLPTKARVFRPHEAAAEATRVRNDAASGLLLYFNTDSVPGEAGLAFLDELTAADIASNFGRVAKLELLANLAERRARLVRARISDASVEILARYQNVAEKIQEAAALPLLGFLPSASARALLPGVAPAVEFDKIYGIRAANRIKEALACIDELDAEGRAAELADAFSRRLLPDDRDDPLAAARRLADAALRVATGRERDPADRRGLTVEFVRLLRGGDAAVSALLAAPVSLPDPGVDPPPGTPGACFEQDVLDVNGRPGLECSIEVDADGDGAPKFTLLRGGDEISLRPSAPLGLFELILASEPSHLDQYRHQGCAYLMSGSRGSSTELLTATAATEGARANPVTNLPEPASSWPQELRASIACFCAAREAMVKELGARVKLGDEGQGGLRHALHLLGGLPLCALAPLRDTAERYLATYRDLIGIACSVVLPDAVNRWLVNLDVAFAVTPEQRVAAARLLPLHPLRISRALRWLDSGVEPPQVPARLAVDYRNVDLLGPAGADLFAAIAVSPPAGAALRVAASSGFDSAWSVLRGRGFVSSLRISLVNVREPAVVVESLVDQARERFESDAEVGSGVHLEVAFVLSDPVARESFHGLAPADLTDSAREALGTRCGEGVSLSLAATATPAESDSHLIIEAVDVAYSKLPGDAARVALGLPLRYVPGPGGNVAQVELRDSPEISAYEQLLKANEIMLGRRGLEPAASSPGVGSAIVRAIVAHGGWPVRASEVPLLSYSVNDGHVVAVLCEKAVTDPAVESRLSRITTNEGISVDDLRRGVVGLYSCRSLLTDLLDPEHDESHLRGNLGLVRAFLRASYAQVDVEILPVNADSPEGLRWARMAAQLCGGGSTRPDLLLIERRRDAPLPKLRVVELKARALASAFDTKPARQRLSEQARIAASRVAKSFDVGPELGELKGALQRLFWLEAGRQHKALEWAEAIESLESALDAGVPPDICIECWVVPESKWEGPDQFEEDHPAVSADGTGVGGAVQRVRFEILQPLVKAESSGSSPPPSKSGAEVARPGEDSEAPVEVGGEPSAHLGVPSVTPQPRVENATDGPHQTGMRVVLGTIEHAGCVEEAIWTPNLTDRVNHFNVGITGTMGTGKTQITKSLVAQLLRDGPNNLTRRAPGLLIFDYKGDYVDSEREPFATDNNAVVLEPANLPINPLHPYTPTTSQELALIPRSFADTLCAINPQIGAVQRKDIIGAVEESFETAGILKTDRKTWARPFPTVSDLLPRLALRKKAQGIPVAIVEDLVALGVFAEVDPTTDLDQFLDSVHVVNLKPVTDARAVVRSIICFFMDAFYARMKRGGEAATARTPTGRETRALRRLVLVDEADDFIGLGLNSLKNVMQQGRSFGCGVILSTQLLDHFERGDDPLKALIGTWVLHQMPDLRPGVLRNLFGLGSNEAAARLAHQIATLPKHTSLCRGLSNDGRQNELTLVRDLPYKDLSTRR